MSTGTKRFMIEGASWLTLMASVFFSVFYYDDLKALARQAFETAGEVGQQAGRGIRQEVGARSQSRRRQDLQSGSGRTVHLAAQHGGHFFARAYINGRQIDVMVDTGATGVALTHDDAETVGLFVRDQDFTLKSRTANGYARSAPVILDRVRIGDIEIDDVRASVSEPGRLHITLLGMTFLSKLSRVEIKGDELVLTE